MDDSEISVDIFSPHGIYPSRSVVCESIAYLISSGIPMLVSEAPVDSTARWERGKNSELLFGAFLLTHKSFPSFSFHPHPVASMHFKHARIPEVISDILDVINFKRELPCLYDPYTGKGDRTDPSGYINRLRSSEAYIDLFHAPQVQFTDLVAKLKAQYSISDQYFRPEVVAGLFQRMNDSSRLVHIAIHYFANAARLIREDFIEDAGLNLNLVLEAIVEDVAATCSIKDKRRAIEKLKEMVLLPYDHMEFLGELYCARNEFLAHIDKDMFTECQNINDPDRYCYEHFESVSWLIRRYIKHLSSLKAAVRH